MLYVRLEEGVKGLGLLLLKLQCGVLFGVDEFDLVDIIIMLVVFDKYSYIEMILVLVELFFSDVDMEKLYQVKNLEDIKKIIDCF